MLQISLISTIVSFTILNQIIQCSPLPDTTKYKDRGQIHYQNNLPDSDKPFLLDSNANSAEYDRITTIDQVQSMLANNPNLPRLTKGEIEDLFEEVTKEEYEKSMKQGDLNRANHMRALMLVLPYNTDNNSEQSLQDLFNRPPVTKVIPTPEKKLETRWQTIVEPTGKVEIISIANQYMSPTTYKPIFKRKTISSSSSPTPITTYHPEQTFSRTASIASKKSNNNNHYHNYEIIKISRNDPLNHFADSSDSFNFDSVQSEIIEKPQRFSSHYNARKTNFNKKDIYHNDNAPAFGDNFKTMTPELEDVLKNLGFAAQAQFRNHFNLNKQSNIDDIIDIPKPIISSIIKQDRVSVNEFEPISVNVKDFSKSLAPQTTSDDYIAFKPLNTRNTAQIEPELEDYLIRFGLVDTDRRSRSEKLIKAPPKIEKITAYDTVTTNRNVKRIDQNIDESIADGTNIFNPTKSDNDDYKELGKLLKNLRELQELRVNLTEDNLKRLELSNYNLSESLLAQGPNPIDMPEFSDLQKNEVKRQEEKSATEDFEPTRYNLGLNFDSQTTDSTISSVNDNEKRESVTTTEFSLFTTELNSDTTTQQPITTTTEESSNGALSDLEDSFGKLDPVTEEPLPPPRKNGFYFTADINSFLEVGDGEEKVLVRFNPKIGDPSRFIPVKVP